VAPGTVFLAKEPNPPLPSVFVEPNVGVVAPGTVFLAKDPNPPPLPRGVDEPKAGAAVVGAVFFASEPNPPLGAKEDAEPKAGVVIGTVAPGTVFFASEPNPPLPSVAVLPKAGVVVGVLVLAAPPNEAEGVVAPGTVFLAKEPNPPPRVEVEPKPVVGAGVVVEPKVDVVVPGAVVVEPKSGEVVGPEGELLIDFTPKSELPLLSLESTEVVVVVVVLAGEPKPNEPNDEVGTSADAGEGDVKLGLATLELNKLEVVELLVDLVSGTTCSVLVVVVTLPKADNGLSTLIVLLAAPKADLFEANPIFVVEPNKGTVAASVFGLFKANPAEGVAGIF
jgi:hypothetical protein